MKLGFISAKLLLGILLITSSVAQSTAKVSVSGLIARHEIEQNSMWIDGKQITFFLQDRTAQAAFVEGTFKARLDELGRGVFSATFTFDRMDELLLSYQVFALYDDPEESRLKKSTFKIWRGPKAKPAATKVETLSGKIATVVLPSKFLPSARAVSFYVPPGAESLDDLNVIYMTDGQAVVSVAPILESAMLEGKIPPTLLVGIHNSEDRYFEYALAGRKFDAHESFVLQEVIPFAEETFGASNLRAKRVIAGFSNGADWTLMTMAKHADLFAGALTISPPANLGDVDWSEQNEPVIYLAAGVLEESIFGNTQEIFTQLGSLGATRFFDERVAGHDFENYKDTFLDAYQWVLLNISAE